MKTLQAAAHLKNAFHQFPESSMAASALQHRIGGAADSNDGAEGGGGAPQTAQETQTGGAQSGDGVAAAAHSALHSDLD